MSEETKPKADEPKADEPKADEPKADEPKAEAEQAADEAKADEADASEPKADDARPDEAKPDEAKADADAKTSVQRSDDDDGAVLDAKGRERPRFLLAFPEHPDLARLVAAFEAGNYALVREEAEALAERTENPAVRDAALELRRRIEPDPLVKYLLALTAALLLFLAYFAYNH
jgi:hypothetical protein